MRAAWRSDIKFRCLNDIMTFFSFATFPRTYQRESWLRLAWKLRWNMYYAFRLNLKRYKFCCEINNHDSMNLQKLDCFKNERSFNESLLACFSQRIVLANRTTIDSRTIIFVRPLMHIWELDTLLLLLLFILWQ